MLHRSVRQKSGGWPRGEHACWCSLEGLDAEGKGHPMDRNHLGEPKSTEERCFERGTNLIFSCD
jgi:hypothetical protein